MTIVGSTDLMSICGRSTSASADRNAVATTMTIMKRTVKNLIADRLLRRGHSCGVRLCNALEEKSSTILGHAETQLQVRALSLNFGRLHVEQQFGILQAQPALRVVVQIARELGRALGRIQFQEQLRSHRILQGERKPEQLGRIKQFRREDRIKNARVIEW